MLFILGSLLYLLFIVIAIVAAFLGALYAQRAYNTMPGGNDEKRDLLIIAILNWIIFGIMALIFILFVVVYVIVLVGRVQPAPLLYIGLISLIGGASILTSWYLIFITVQLATNIAPNVKTSKRNIGYATVSSLAAGLFSILGVICLIALSKHVDGRPFNQETYYDEEGNKVSPYVEFFNRY